MEIIEKASKYADRDTTPRIELTSIRKYLKPNFNANENIIVGTKVRDVADFCFWYQYER